MDVPLSEVLLHLLSPDNANRARAEAVYNSYVEASPVNVVLALLQLVRAGRDPTKPDAIRYGELARQ